MSLFGPQPRKSDANPGKVSPGDVFDYERAKNDPVFFAERFITVEGGLIELAPFQKKLLEKGAPIILKGKRGPYYRASVHHGRLVMKKLNYPYS